MSGALDEEWVLSARCRGMGDAMFPGAPEQRRVRELCAGCPVRNQCLAEALDARMEWGVWGGMTERGRRLLLRQHPDVVSWRALLCER